MSSASSQPDSQVPVNTIDDTVAEKPPRFSYSLVPRTAGGSYDKTDCVKDDITGLIWEGKTASGTRAGTGTFTNFVNLDAAVVPNSSIKPTQSQVDANTNALGYRNLVNAMQLCGFNDWRMPTANELKSLVDISMASPQTNSVAMVNAEWFPNTPGYAYYWSSTRYTGVTENSDAYASVYDIGTWAITFSGAYFDIGDDRSNRHYVRLVR